MKRARQLNGALGGLLTALLVGACLLAGCGTGSTDFTGVNTSQVTILENQEATVSVSSGAQAHFPAGTLAKQTVVVFSDILVSSDASEPNYPTATKVAEDLVAAVVINIPADALMSANVDVTFATRAGITAVAGEHYCVYRYDFDNKRWNRWGATLATMDGTGTLATALLPTDGMYGFIGSLAIFAGLTETSQGAAVPTVINGMVTDGSSAPVATDVSLYYLIGSQKTPVAVTGGHALAGGTVANAVNSAADGSFTMTIPENLIGQLIAIEFGKDDTAWATQTRFNVLAPAETPLADVLSMVIRYGANNVTSLPLVPGA